MLVLWLTPAGFPVSAQQTRDATSAPATGTATVRGTVVTNETPPHPLRRAIVTVSGPAVPHGQSAIADDAGEFTVRNLPAGPVTITTVKRGYVPGAFGARRPGGPGTPVELADGQSFHAQIAMTRGAVVTGVIRDAGGEPIPDVLVFAIDTLKRLEDVAGSIRSESGQRSAAVTTDDRGAYRIFDLAPGEYLVAAVAMNSQSTDLLRPSTAEMDRILARLQQPTAPGVSRPQPLPRLRKGTLSPVFYPGTTAITDAALLKLTVGEERQATDFVMTPVPVAAMEGVIASDVVSMASVQLTISPPNALNLFALASALPVLATPPGADGRFRYANLIPGRYTLFARANRFSPTPSGRGRETGVPSLERGGAGSDARGNLYAVETVTIDGNDVSGITLQLRPGGLVSGRIRLDPATAGNVDFSQWKVSLSSIATGSYSTTGATVIGNNFGVTPPAAAAADGRFEIAGVAPGTYRIDVQKPGAFQSWWLRSAVAGGRDLLDTMLDVGFASEQSDVALTLTDRPSEISGRLLNPGNLPAPDYTVVIVPADRALRTASSRRVRSTRPSTEGAFSFPDLPSGGYLLAVVTDVDPLAWRTSELLEQVASAGVKVTIADGEKKRQDLRVR
jgi:hypothetical protein